MKTSRTPPPRLSLLAHPKYKQDERKMENNKKEITATEARQLAIDALARSRVEIAESESEVNRFLAIKALAEMCISDDDTAIVAVATPYKRSRDIDISAVIRAPSCYSDREHDILLLDCIKGSPLWDFVWRAIAFPEASASLERADEIHNDEMVKMRKQTFEQGRVYEFNRICELLKGGEG